MLVITECPSFVFSGKKAKYAGRYRITDSDSLEAAMEAAGRIRLTIEAKLSPGPPMLNLRRHGVNGRWHEICDNVASGNFLGAKVNIHTEPSITSRIVERIELIYFLSHVQ